MSDQMHPATAKAFFAASLDELEAKRDTCPLGELVALVAAKDAALAQWEAAEAAFYSAGGAINWRGEYIEPGDVFRSELTEAGEQTIIPGCERNAAPGPRQLDLFG